MLRGDQNIGIAQNVGDLQRRQARLLCAEEFARAAQLQIHLGDLESILRIDQRADAFFRGVVQLRGNQQAVALLGAASHASAQLVQLREAEALGLLDQHHGGVRNIDADFDHGGGNQDLRAPDLKASIAASFSAEPRRPCSRPTGISGKISRESCSYICCAAFMACVSDSSMTG